MTKRELEEMEGAVLEAYNRLVELNKEYNELLTKEHEEKANSEKNQDVSWQTFMSALGMDSKSEKDAALFKANMFYWLRMFLIFGLTMSGVVNIIVATVLILGNSFYSGKKFQKVREKYVSTEQKSVNVAHKEKKDKLYDEVSDARSLYHKLKKEFDSKKLNVELKGEEENLNSMGSDDKEELYRLFEAYIDYVKNVSATSNGISRSNGIKMYELKSNDYK